jgi:eukaryotic-like serine/threonine-protein kinase
VPIDQAPTLPADPSESTVLSEEQPGQCIGRYKLIQKIGEGGFGVVWMAQQEQPLRRRVALKIIKLGMDTKQVIARFEAERQALALMDHPNIARVFDGGATESGRPYFVMELVQGMPITDYCDQKRLDPESRLRLFMQVCLGVQHAHQKGIIHRDLKPSNILVTVHDDKPVPKIIDFGIAKATLQPLTENTVFTRFNQLLGTPSYMSPEQAGFTCEDVDTRSDVYALGVLLYELLTGRTPFAKEELLKAGFEQMCKVIREKDPPKPSTRLSTLSADERSSIALSRQATPEKLSRFIRGELDWVVMKALEKDRARRYESASALALDLDRYLHDQPITAVAPSVGYLLLKFAHRNRAALATAAAFVLVLVVATGFSLVLAYRATHFAAERDQQWQRAQDHAANESRERLRAEKAITRLEIERAELLFGNQRAADALAYLARVLRNEPSHRAAAERIMAALSQRNFCLPAIPPLQHSDWITAAEFSPDGARILTASRDQTARLWEARSGRPLLAPMRHAAAIVSARFSKDGKRIVTASTDRTARVWNAETAQPLSGPLQHTSELMYAEFSPDGELIVTAATNGTFRVWNAERGTPQTEVLGAPTNHVSTAGARFSPDGHWIIAFAGNRVQIWNARTGEERARPRHDGNDLSFAEYHPGGEHVAIGGARWVLLYLDAASGMAVQDASDSMPLTCGTFSPNGERFAMGTSQGAIRILDGKTAELHSLLKHGERLTSLEFSFDGNWLLSAAQDNTARLWDASTSQPITEPLQHDTPLRLARFSPDAQRVLTVPEGHSAWIWEIRSGPPLANEFRLNARTFGAWFSPDGRRLLTTQMDRGAPRLWDVQTGRLLKELTDSSKHVWEAQFSPDGSKIITTGLDGKAHLWETESGQLLKTLDHEGKVYSPMFSANGQWLVTASADHSAALWEVVSGRKLQSFPHRAAVTSIRFSPDGTRVVTASADRTARIWNTATGQPAGAQIEHADEITGAEFDSSGRMVVTASRDKTARVWDGWTGKPLGTPMQHDHGVDGIHFSSKSSHFVARSGNSARIWDAITSKPISETMKHESRINSARFSHDGLRIVTSSEDMTARIWDAETGLPLCDPIRHPHVVSYAEFSPDDLWIATASVNARLWQIPVAAPPLPDWLPAVAEAVAGKRFNARHELESVSPGELFRLRQQMTASIATNDFTRWAQWFFSEVDSRPVSSLSSTLSSNSPTRLRERASLMMGRGEWRTALNCLTKSLHLESTHAWNWDWFYTPMLHLKIGDLAGYQRQCQLALQRFGSETNPVIARRIALSCLTQPPRSEDMSTVERLVEISVKQGHDYREFAKGLFEYRQGRFATAVEWLEQALKKREFPGRDAQAWAILAMAQHQLKNFEAARAALAKAKSAAEKVSKPDPGEFDDQGWYRTDYAKDWYNWLVNQGIQIFLHEAETLLAAPAASGN